MPTGAVRRGASAQPTPLTRQKRSRNMDSVHGHLGPGCRTPSGIRWQRRVGDRHGRPGRASGQTGLTATFGWSRETETCWSVRRERGNLRPRSGSARRSGSHRPSGRSGQRSCGSGAEGTGATPTGLSEIGSDWHQDRGLGQPGQRESVPTGSQPGDRRRVRKRGIARRAERRDGRCEQVESKVNARRSICGGPVHESPRRVRRRKPATRRGHFRFRRPAPAERPPPGLTPPTRKMRRFVRPVHIPAHISVGLRSQPESCGGLCAACTFQRTFRSGCHRRRPQRRAAARRVT